MFKNILMLSLGTTLMLVSMHPLAWAAWGISIVLLAGWLVHSILS